MLSFLDRTKSADSVTTPTTAERSRLGDLREFMDRAWRRTAGARAWFRAFRRTRPFWGGLWLLVGGWLILRLSMVSVQIVVSAGLAGFGGWLTGGGLIVCGLIAWAAPTQRYIAGIIAILLAVASLVLSNLGGMFFGMLFGILGGAMVLAWGPKKTRSVVAEAEPEAETEVAVKSEPELEGAGVPEPAAPKKVEAKQVKSKKGKSKKKTPTADEPVT